MYMYMLVSKLTSHSHLSFSSLDAVVNAEDKLSKPMIPVELILPKVDLTTSSLDGNIRSSLRAGGFPWGTRKYYIPYGCNFVQSKIWSYLENFAGSNSTFHGF